MPALERSAFETIAGTAIRTHGFSCHGDIEKYAGVPGPEGHRSIRAMQRQVLAGDRYDGIIARV